ncbi:MAG TPA: protein kinase family protein [Candidatus Binataceae bacterium]|nr:protein kinase family protein [Candidatus Binataceae bacterium]
MNTLGGWELIEPKLGQGGQGTVHRARRPERVVRIENARRDLLRAIENLAAVVPTPDREDRLNDFIATIGELTRPDSPTEIGALKQFDIPADVSDEAKTAEERFKREVEALTSINHPGILKLLDKNVAERWFVTEYHPGGTLAQHIDRYKGDALSALKAFSSIVDAVAEIHNEGYVHRDIKAENVFIAADGRLVLGDFGIVFFEHGDRTRLTATFEKAGTTMWMAPWAVTGRRVDDVNATFDVFPLGKLLWTMVAGERYLPVYQTHRGEGYKLRDRFPDRIGMEEINSILDKCVVLQERECLQDAGQLRKQVDAVIQDLEAANRPELDEVILKSPTRRFGIRLTAIDFQIQATPLRRDDSGKWVERGESGPVGIRWTPDPNGFLHRLPGH